MNTQSDAAHRIVYSAIEDARRRGLDQVGQLQKAVFALRNVEPDRSAGEITRMVERMLAS